MTAHGYAWSFVRLATHFAGHLCSFPLGYGPRQCPGGEFLSCSRQSWHRALHSGDSQPVRRCSGVVTTSGEAKIAHLRP